jgi:gluconate:H+ symporter, GntP family
MYGMPIAQALVFVAAVIVIIAAIQWRQCHPFLTLVAVAAVFGFIAGFPTSILGRVFGTGFSDAIYSPGLIIVGAALIGGIAETTTASDRLWARIEGWRSKWPWLGGLGANSLGGNGLAAVLGLIAGIGTSPAAAFALLMPLLRPIGGKTAQQREGATVTLGLVISASHGLVVLTPIPIAAAAIIDADWIRVALFGVPLAILVAAFGAIFSRWSSSAGHASETSAQSYPPPAPDRRGGGSALALCLAVLVPLGMLMFQSVGNIPSEPLGGGPTRELILGTGRPLILFLAGVGIMIIGQPRQGFGLVKDSAWTARVFGNVAGLLLIVCAAGGLQRLCQETGMATLLAEHVLDWQIGAMSILVPFFVAAAMKTFQGSSLVAAITAAGMVQPLATALGLGGTNGKALAALAIGAGAMTVSHVNDGYFWLVVDRAGLAPLRGLTAFSLGTLLQGLLAAAVLLILSLLVGNT